ncbi:electron transfer flavoprotein subunit alpha/FixB family protein [Thermodesulfobacteriota bacterium]
MSEIFVVIEHRQGEVRDISYEMLFKANELCQKLSHTLTAILIGGKDMPFVEQIAEKADKVILFEDEKVASFKADQYKDILNGLLAEHSPFMTLIGHTAWGMDLAPCLSVKCGFPLVTDCVDILVEDNRPLAIRQIYSGKIYTKVSFKEAGGYLITARPGAFTPDEVEKRQGEIIRKELPADLPEARKQFVEFMESGAGDVDITQAELLVSVGRGVGEEENIPIVKDLADQLGGTLSCSRPIVDKNWLPKFHQVGTSGKSVKPKVYFAFGISGAFQHVAGITGAGTVIAVNKDPKAPIFRVADYGVADDLFKIADALKAKLAE